MDERLLRRLVEELFDNHDITPIAFELGMPLVDADLAESGTGQHPSARSVFDENP